MLSKDKNDQKCQDFLYWNSFIKTEIIFFMLKTTNKLMLGHLGGYPFRADNISGFSSFDNTRFLIFLKGFYQRNKVLAESLLFFQNRNKRRMI